MQATQTPVAEPARLLGVRQVADLLGVSGRHVYRLADGGRMPRPLKLGGAVRWDRDEIKRWIDSGCPAVVEQKGGRR
jgi:excisionase family DNA binding protein